MSNVSLNQPGNFLVAVLTRDHGWQKVGFVQGGKRLQCCDRAAAFFQANTRARKELLEACHILNGKQANGLLGKAYDREEVNLLRYRNVRGTEIRVLAI